MWCPWYLRLCDHSFGMMSFPHPVHMQSEGTCSWIVLFKDYSLRCSSRPAEVLPSTWGGQWSGIQNANSFSKKGKAGFKKCQNFSQRCFECHTWTDRATFRQLLIPSITHSSLQTSQIQFIPFCYQVLPVQNSLEWSKILLKPKDLEWKMCYYETVF